MSKQQIIFLLYSLKVGGAERRAATIANYLADHDVDVTIALLDSPNVIFDMDPRVRIVYLHTDEAVDLTGNTAKVHIFECGTVPKISVWDKLKLKTAKWCSSSKFTLLEKEYFLQQKYVFRIKQFVKTMPRATVVSWMSYCNVSALCAMQHLPNKAVFVECMSPEAEFPNGHYMNILKKRYYPRAQKAIFQTNQERDFYTYLPHTEKYVIPNPVNAFYPDRHTGARRKSIVNFCRLEKQKNIPLLLDAFKLLSEDYPEYILEIYGDGSEKDNLMMYTKSLGIADKVLFHPFDVALHDKIKDCAMFVSSSDREGISNSMLEALAIGLPTICTNCPAGGAEMLITPYENGLIVPMRDPQAMYMAMKEVVDNPQLAEKMSMNAVKIKETLAVDKICDQWQKALS